MKYTFRGHVVFEYIPHTKQVKQHKIEGSQIPAFDFCSFIPEDFKLLSEFFATAYKHTQGEEVELKDIDVN